MNARNILVSKNYNILDHSTWHQDRSAEKNISNNYNEMEKIMVSSAVRNVRDLHAVIIHRDTVSDVRELFRMHFEQIYDLWKTRNHNILYADLDVVFAARSRYFGVFDKFTMFNFTDPMSTQCDHYGITLKHFFNCGVRYYPADMSEEVWDMGFDMLRNWNPDRYDSEQVIYNAMMWAQSDQLNDFYRPDLAFQVLTPDALHNHRFNRISEMQAKTFHVHGTRGSGNRLSIMQRLYNTGRMMGTNELHKARTAQLQHDAGYIAYSKIDAKVHFCI